MFGLPGIIVLFALGGVPVEPQPPDEDGFAALCRGPWMEAREDAPYRGVSVEDWGSGQCCRLGIRGAFVCEMSPGHQHGPVIKGHLRFYDGSSTRPRRDLVVSAWPNPGMNPDPGLPSPKPYALYRLQRTADGFALVFRAKPRCAELPAFARDVCSNAGRWVLEDGIPRRPK